MNKEKPMKTKQLHITRIRVNEDNPRQIKEERFNKLISSLVVFPKMLELRPITVDKDIIALGGNMRFRGLMAILDMSVNEIRDIIEKSRKMINKPQSERDALLEYWLDWKKDPVVEVGDASDLTEEERREFIAKDNIEYGEWDNDELANKWDNEDLIEWGVDVWSDDSDYSEKNKEINVGDISDEVTLKLKYSEGVYNRVKAKLSELAGTPEEALLKLLGL